MTPTQIAYCLLIIALFISLHQFLLWGTWFEVTDIHHELFISTFGFGGLLILGVVRFRRKLR